MKRVDGIEEFLWRCLAQPRDVRESLKRVQIEHVSDPVVHLIHMAVCIRINGPQATAITNGGRHYAGCVQIVPSYLGTLAFAVVVWLI